MSKDLGLEKAGSMSMGNGGINTPRLLVPHGVVKCCHSQARHLWLVLLGQSHDHPPNASRDSGIGESVTRAAANCAAASKTFPAVRQTAQRHQCLASQATRASPPSEFEEAFMQTQEYKEWRKVGTLLQRYWRWKNTGVDVLRGVLRDNDNGEPINRRQIEEALEL